MYKVIVLDLDGTLTNSKKEITKRTKEALLKAQEQGVKVVLASGRPTQGIVALADELELETYGGYILSFNGARIIDYKTKEIVFQQTLPTEWIPTLIDLAKQYEIEFLTYEDDSILASDITSQYVEIESRINKMNVRQMKNPTEEITFEIPKILMVGDGDYMATVEPKVQEATKGVLSVYRSEPYFLEVMPKGVDKATSLARLLEELKLTKEEMIACGDGFNDLSMIQFAGLGVAMENAQPIVKEHADYITTSNDEDGVAKVVEKFILNE